VETSKSVCGALSVENVVNRRHKGVGATDERGKVANAGDLVRAQFPKKAVSESAQNVSEPLGALKVAA